MDLPGVGSIVSCLPHRILRFVLAPPRPAYILHEANALSCRRQIQVGSCRNDLNVTESSLSYNACNSPGFARLNRPGAPGGGGTKRARLLIIDAGIATKGHLSGAENITTATFLPVLTTCRMLARSFSGSGKNHSAPRIGAQYTCHCWRRGRSCFHRR
jgi:hypothetical protein